MSVYPIDAATSEEIPLHPVEPPKSVPVAVLLSLLWPGLGHLYAGATGTGIAFAVYCLLTFGIMGRIVSSVNVALMLKRQA